MRIVSGLAPEGWAQWLLVEQADMDKASTVQQVWAPIVGTHIAIENVIHGVLCQRCQVEHNVTCEKVGLRLRALHHLPQGLNHSEVKCPYIVAMGTAETKPRLQAGRLRLDAAPRLRRLAYGSGRLV